MGLGGSLLRAVGYYDEHEDGDYEDEGPMARDEFELEFEERRAQRRSRRLSVVHPKAVTVSLAEPHEFEDAQYIADRFRAGAPVIVDLRSCEAALHKRMIDFCAGLTYALDGGLERIDAHTLFLAPSTVELSSSAGSGFLERGFFNQL
jgi:cell division inhibitor SepF